MKKTQDEEEAIFENIENVSHDLKDQVGELQKFIRELKEASQRRINRSPLIREDKGGVQYG